MKKNSILSILMLLSMLTLQTDCLPTITARDVIIATGSIVTSVAATLCIVEQVHPAFLEHKKLEREAAQKAKQEEQVKKEKEQAALIESQKIRAQNTFMQLNQTYKCEIDLLNTNTIAPKELIEIIKKKYNNQKTPFAIYNQTLQQDIQVLQSLEPFVENKTALSLLSSQLEQLLYVHNLHIGDILKEEQSNTDQKRKQEEADARAIEREILEIKKLKNDIKQTEIIEKEFSKLVSQIDNLKHILDNHEKSRSQYFIELISMLNIFQSKQAQENETLKKTLKQNHSLNQENLHTLQRLLEALLKNCTPATYYPSTSYHQSAYNPENSKPSAPPL